MADQKFSKARPGGGASRPSGFRPPRPRPEAEMAAVALDALVAVEAGRAADRVLKNAFDKRKWPPHARARIAGLVLGIERHRRQIDWWLDHVESRPAPLARLVAALALLDGLEKAAINKHLPNLPAPEKQAMTRLIQRSLNHPDQPAAVQANLPDWLMKPFARRFGRDLAAEAAALVGETGLDLRANTVKTTREGAIAALAADGISAVPPP